MEDQDSAVYFQVMEEVLCCFWAASSVWKEALPASLQWQFSGMVRNGQHHHLSIPALLDIPCE